MKQIKSILPDQQVPFPLGIVVSQFNTSITQALLEGTLMRLKKAGFEEEHITVVQVPGALEIPLTVKCLLKQNHYDAIIALGAVIRGETSHYDYVCQQVSEGCQRVSLESEKPVIFGVLTTENEAQAWDRLGGAHGHKGIEAAECAIIMQDLMKKLRTSKH